VPIVSVHYAPVIVSVHYPPVNDFTFYWDAAAKLVAGHNPYIPFYRGCGCALLAPPWILPVIAPVGVLPLQVAQLVWMFVSVTSIFISVLWLWELYGEGKIPLWAGLLVVSFTPVFVMILLGQLSAIMLLGLVGFLRYEGKRPYLAGAFLFLLAIKPQVAFLVWPALLLCALFQQRWKPLAAFLGTLAVMTAIALVLDPHAFPQWLSALVVNRATAYETPTIGTLLRHATGHPWMQFLPAALAVVWFAWYWQASESRWDWKTQVPLLLLVSILASNYAWYTDHVLLLPALFYAAVRLWQSGARVAYTVFAYLAINLTALMLVWTQQLAWYTWAALAWLAMYRVIVLPNEKVRRLTRKDPVGSISVA
jgi:hypothetical protein